MIDDNYEVVEFENYSQIFNRWFKIRKLYYTARIDRQVILVEAKIKYYENILRFCKEHGKYKINSKVSLEKFNERIGSVCSSPSK